MTATPFKQVNYFDFDGRAELIRLIFAYAGIEYKEVTCTLDDWPTARQKFPFQTVPVLEFDGTQIAQSNTIVRYLARVAGIDGKTNSERVLADMYADTFVHDIVEKAYPFRVSLAEPDAEKRRIKGEQFVKDKLISFIEQLEETYKKNGGGPWFCGETFTYADLAFFRMMNNIMYLMKHVSVAHSALRENYQRVAEIPCIAEYQKTKKQRPF